MLNYRSMARSASKRQEAITSRISLAKSELVAMEKELKVLDEVLKALPSAGLSRGSSRQGKANGRGAKKAAKKGKWKPGKPGRPPQWYIDQQKGKGANAPKATRAKPRVAAGKPAKKPKVKRKATEKQLAAMAKAREALAANRKATKAGEAHLLSL